MPKAGVLFPTETTIANSVEQIVPGMQMMTESAVQTVGSDLQSLVA
jgi:hypothetical protein